jgi:predicted ATP-dependent endonuclease of OLD family
MKIYDISISYYRGIELLENLKFGSINSFVGKNDSGKSNILRALDSFFNNSFSFNDVFKGIPEGKITEIKIRFEPSETINPLALDSDGKITLIKQFSYTSAGKLTKDFLYECNDIDETTLQNCWGIKESEINDYLDKLGVSYSKSGRGVTNLSKIEKIYEATSEIDKVTKTHPADDFIKNLTKQYESFELPEFALFNADQDLNVGSTDFQNQFKPIATQSLEKNSDLTEKIESNVQDDLENEFQKITELMRKNVPNLEKISPSINCNWKNLVKFNLSLRFNSESFEIPIENKGTGFKRLLMVAYFEYLAQKQTKKHLIFGLEEPETFLHPELQSELLESIISLSEDSQFFITTHSPIFAGSTQKTNIVVVKKENEVSNYLNYENENEILDVVIKELGIRPNYNLLNDNYRKIIFVEGKGDVLFWGEAFNKINGGLPADILFVPCGGDQVEFFVNAELCKKINRKFMFVLDSDRGAVDFATKEANKQQLKQKIVDMGGTLEILRKREIENYYHRAAIQRVLGDRFALPDEFQVEDYIDMQSEIKEKILIPAITLNFKVKNNMDVFSEMTPEEWIEVAAVVDDSTA